MPRKKSKVQEGARESLDFEKESTQAEELNPVEQLAAQLHHIQDKSKARHGHLSLVFDPPSSEEMKSVHEAFTPASVLAYADTLLVDTKIKPEEFILKSRDILLVIKQLGKISENEILERQKELHEFMRSNTMIDEVYELKRELGRLARANGIIKFFMRSRRVALEERMRKIELEEAKIKEKLEQARELNQSLVSARNYNGPLYQLQMKEESLFAQAIAAEIDHIRMEYSRFGATVESEKVVTGDIFDEKERNIIPRMAAYLDEKERNMMPRMVAYLQYQDYLGLKESVYGKDRFLGSFSGYSSHPTSLREVLESAKRVFDQLPSAGDWKTFRSSEAVQKIFGANLEALDRWYYEKCLQNSLVDHEGNSIDRLVDYPTPDAIRNLILIAAADARSYRTVHANDALAELMQRPDWKDILDKAQVVHPNIKGVRPLLEKWESYLHSNHPDIQRAVTAFSIAILDSFPPDSNEAMLAAETLPDTALVDLVEKRKVVEQVDLESIRRAQIFLQVKKEAYNLDKNNLTYIDTYNLRREVRKICFNLLQPKLEKKEREVMQLQIEQLSMLCAKLVANQEHPETISYLTSLEVIDKQKEGGVAEGFLDAAMDCPELGKDIDLRRIFCNQFKGQETTIFFKNLLKVVENISVSDRAFVLETLAKHVGGGQLSEKRALEIPELLGDILQGSLARVAINTPAIFLAPEDGPALFRQMRNRPVGTWAGASDPHALDVHLGTLQRPLSQFNSPLFNEMNDQTNSDLIKSINANPNVVLDESNWVEFLCAYMQAEIGLGRAFDNTVIDRAKHLFGDPKMRDFCLQKLREKWRAYVQAGTPEAIPYSLQFIIEIMKRVPDAGALSQIESIGGFVDGVITAFDKKTTWPKTKTAILTKLAAVEERGNRERWGNVDWTDFYNLSRDMVTAAPNLFSDCLDLYVKLSPAEMKRFGREIYPLYRIALVLKEKKGLNGEIVHERADVVGLRQRVRKLAKNFRKTEKQFENEKTALHDDMKKAFKERFGIIKVPETFSAEHGRSLANMMTYLTNLSGRNPEGELTLSFYLALMLNDQWENFRQGKVVDPKEYLAPAKAELVQKKLDERSRLNPLTAERVGVTTDQMPEFASILQTETQTIVVGNIETVDVKLSSIMTNLHGLEDMDLYPDPMDKARMVLLLRYGNKVTSGVVAKMQKNLRSPGKEAAFSAEEESIRKAVVDALVVAKKETDAPTLKAEFQDVMKPFAAVVNLLRFAEETGVTVQIDELRAALKPSENIIAIFKRLGEDFTPTSGVKALSQDLQYLDNLIVKKEKELTPEEKVLLQKFIQSIRDRVVELEKIFGQIKDKFGGLKGSQSKANELLQAKLTEIEKIINIKDTAQTITTTMTNNFNTIIENIRECLACVRQGANNDTNLTFGDSNKFHLVSHSDAQEKGSIADQIIFFEPVVKDEKLVGMAFVFDRMYGANTPTVLENHIAVVWKKGRALKNKFKDIPLTLFVTDAAISTGGLSGDMLIERLDAKKITSTKETLDVNVTPSVWADHYVEFGGDARQAGKRTVSGVQIIL